MQNGKSWTENTLKPNIKYIWGLSLRESIEVTFFGVLMAVAKVVVKIPLKIPGHSGLLWMAILTTCCLCYKHGRAGTLAGFVAGMLVVILSPGGKGVLTFFKYFIPGLTMDTIFTLFPSTTKNLFYVALISAFCHLTKLAVNFVSGLILHLPLGFITLGVGIATINHAIFGFTAGILGYLIYKKIM